MTPALRAWLPGLAAAAALLTLYWLSTPAGLRVTGDSWHYLSAARSWLARGRWLNPDGTDYRAWGPLYPVLLAATGFGRPDPAAAWRLHALALPATALLWGRLGATLLPRESSRWAYAAALATATPWLAPATFIWSEAGFALLFAAYALAVTQCLVAPRAGWWWAATAAGALLALQRVSGIFLLGGVALGVVLAFPAHARAQWRGWLGHLAGASALALVWQAYATGGVGATRGPAPYHEFRGAGTFSQTLAEYGFTLGRWLVPAPPVLAERPAFGLLVLAALVGLTAFAWRRLPALARLGVVVTAVYVLGHCLTTTFSRGGSGIYNAERYASALYGLVLLLMVAILMPALARRRGPGWRYLWRGALAAWLAYSAARMGKFVRTERQRPPATMPEATLTLTLLQPAA